MAQTGDGTNQCCSVRNNAGVLAKSTYQALFLNCTSKRDHDFCWTYSAIIILVRVLLMRLRFFRFHILLQSATAAAAAAVHSRRMGSMWGSALGRTKTCLCAQLLVAGVEYRLEASKLSRLTPQFLFGQQHTYICSSSTTK